jgi:DNA-directed RNA polymerase specialized sigma24 family protein
MEMRLVRVSDEEIKPLVSSWQSSRDRTLWNDLMSRVAPLIRAYPGFSAGCDEDTCADFYAFLYPKLESLFASWKPTAASFTSWLFVVLRCRYLDFAALRRGHTSVRTFTLVRKRPGETRERDASDRVVVESWKDRIRNDSGKKSVRIRKELKRLVAGLSPERRLLLHLLFDEVGPEDLSFCSGPGEGRGLFEEYCLLRLKASDRLRSDREAVEALGNDILSLRKKRDAVPAGSEEWEKFDKTLGKKRLAQKRAEARLGRHELGLPYSWVAKVTGRSVSSLKHDFQAVRSTARKILGPLIEGDVV